MRRLKLRIRNGLSNQGEGEGAHAGFGGLVQHPIHTAGVWETRVLHTTRAPWRLRISVGSPATSGGPPPVLVFQR